MAKREPIPRKPHPEKRTCSKCGTEKPLTTDNFTPERRDIATGEIKRYARWCKPCKAADARARHAARTPEKVAADREYNRATYELRRKNPEAMERDRIAKKRWQAANRDKLREASRRYWEKLKADPERYQKHLDEQRIAYRLEVGEREVRNVTSAKGAWKPAVGRATSWPVDPLSMWLKIVLDRDQRDRSEIAKEMGISDRVLWRIERQEYPSVTEARAEGLLWNYGRPVEIRARDLEQKLQEWAQDLPGNGTRLLRYLDRAERLAHLADILVCRIEDLWPEMEEAYELGEAA